MRALLIAVALIACKAEAPAPVPVPPPPAAPAKRAATVRVDRRMELVAIVQRLAGAKEYTQAPATSPYVQAVDAWFAPFRSHAAVREAIANRNLVGVSFDAPMLLAAHLDDQLALRNPEELAVLDRRFASIDVNATAASLRAFAIEAKLDEFLSSQQAHIAAVERELRDLVDAEDAVSWFDGVFGRAPAKFFVVPGLLTGTMNYGPLVNLPDGTMELYQVLAVTGRDGTIEPSVELVRLLVHEMAHSYINPVFGKHRAKLEAAATSVYRLVAAEMQAQTYKDPLIMVNEAGVRATVVLYMHERKGAEVGAAAERTELNASFVWTPELVELMRGFQRGGTHDLDAFMPKVIAFWDQLATRYAKDRLPPRRFLGPADATYRGAPMWIASASDGVAPYVREVLQRLRRDGKLLIASARTLSEQRDHDLVAYGNPTTNAVIAEVATAAGWKLDATGITLGARTFSGPGLVLVACWPRPDDASRGVLVYAAADERDLLEVNYKLRHGEHDWLVARRAPAGTFEILATGDFARAADGSWLPPRA